MEVAVCLIISETYLLDFLSSQSTRNCWTSLATIRTYCYGIRASLLLRKFSHIRKQASQSLESYLESKVLAMKAKPVRDDGKKMKPKRKKKLFDLYKVMKQIHPVTGVSCVKPCSLWTAMSAICSRESPINLSDK